MKMAENQPEELSNIDYRPPRKGWLEPHDVLNTYPPEVVTHLLQKRRQGYN